jgi:hypothetical protein
MKDTAFLIFTKTGLSHLAKGRRTRHDRPTCPKLDDGERAVFLSFEVPDSIFDPAPLPVVRLSIAAADAIAPEVSVVVEPVPPAIEEEVRG